MSASAARHIAGVAWAGVAVSCAAVEAKSAKRNVVAVANMRLTRSITSHPMFMTCARFYQDLRGFAALFVGMPEMARN